MWSFESQIALTIRAEIDRAVGNAAPLVVVNTHGQVVPIDERNQHTWLDLNNAMQAHYVRTVVVVEIAVGGERKLSQGGRRNALRLAARMGLQRAI